MKLFVLMTHIQWIAIYQMDSAIQPLNNQGLIYESFNPMEARVENDGTRSRRACDESL